MDSILSQSITLMPRLQAESGVDTAHSTMAQFMEHQDG